MVNCNWKKQGFFEEVATDKLIFDLQTSKQTKDKQKLTNVDHAN